MTKFMIGCDPELFLVDASGALKSSIGRIGGSKEDPKPLPLGDGYAVQEDNVALEFNIPAASSRGQLADHLRKAMSYLSDQIQLQGLQFSNLSAASFPVFELLHPKAQEFGCDPDFNAWKNGEVNPRPYAADRNLRSCGGHVHVGYPHIDSLDKANRLIKFMDFYLGVHSVLLDTDGGPRRQLYGAPGAYRPKSYGVEYRSLSNFWVINNLSDWVWNGTERAINALESGSDIVDVHAEEIQSIINTNNQDHAAVLLRKHGVI